MPQFLFAARREDRHPTSFPPRSDRSRWLPFLGSSVLPRFALLPLGGRMRAAVAPRLIVRGLGNFRRVGVADGGVERLSVVRSFRTCHRPCACGHIHTRMRECTRALCTRTDASLPTCIRAFVECSNAQGPLERRYLNAYLVLGVSTLPRLYVYVCVYVCA